MALSGRDSSWHGQLVREALVERVLVVLGEIKRLLRRQQRGGDEPVVGIAFLLQPVQLVRELRVHPYSAGGCG